MEWWEGEREGRRTDEGGGHCLSMTLHNERQSAAKKHLYGHCAAQWVEHEVQGSEGNVNVFIKHL